MNWFDYPEDDLRTPLERAGAGIPSSWPREGEVKTVTQAYPAGDPPMVKLLSVAESHQAGEEIDRKLLDRGMNPDELTHLFGRFP